MVSKNDIELALAFLLYRFIDLKKRSTIIRNSLLGSVLDRRQEVCDLGVTLDSSLNFRLHVDNTVNKAYKMLGFIFRQFR